MHWCPIKHPDLASCKCFDRSSTYTANKRGYKMPPCLTPFETVKKLDVDCPHRENVKLSLHYIELIKNTGRLQFGTHDQCISLRIKVPCFR